MVENHRLWEDYQFGSQNTWIQILAWPFLSILTLDKFPGLSESRPQRRMGLILLTSLIVSRIRANKKI